MCSLFLSFRNYLPVDIVELVNISVCSQVFHFSSVVRCKNNGIAKKLLPKDVDVRSVFTERNVVPCILGGSVAGWGSREGRRD